MALTPSASSSKKSQAKHWRNTGKCQLLVAQIYLMVQKKKKKKNSQENIFKPLGMNSTSFYLTPELKARTIRLTFPKDGKFEPFVNQTKFIEQEPSRCKHLFYYSLRYY